MQDFWSILGQITNFALGLDCLKVNIHNDKLIPVAMGTTKQAAVDWIPVIQIKYWLIDCCLTSSE
jgi:hypothetical protein